MLESFTFRISLGCQACRTSVPVNGIVPAVTCYQCNQDNACDAAFWASALPPNLFVEARGFESGTGREIVELTGKFRAAYGNRVPRCQKCLGPDIPLESFAEFIVRGSCACTACGTHIRVREADALAKGIVPGALYLVGEEAPDDAARALARTPHPVAFQCISCGAGLKIDGTTRLVPCSFCKTDNYMPDGLWQLLRPTPTVRGFFMVCEAPETAARPRAAVTDFERDVALATDPDTDPSILLELASHWSTDVRTALMQNPNLPSRVVDQLAVDHEVPIVLFAVDHPALSHEVLARLLESGEERVREAARRRVDELHAAGVNIHGPGGFFARLFGRSRSS